MQIYSSQTPIAKDSFFVEFQGQNGTDNENNLSKKELAVGFV